jgi:hypothetical protein
MCRWNAYIGEPLMLDELLFRTEHGLIDQSLHSRIAIAAGSREQRPFRPQTPSTTADGRRPVGREV